MPEMAVQGSSFASSLSSLVDASLSDLSKLGLHLQRRWLEALALHLSLTSPSSLSSLSFIAYSRVLHSSLTVCTRPSLPPSLSTSPLTHLPGQYVLIVLACHDVSSPTPSPLSPPSSHSHPRLLRLLLSDGHQCVLGLEVQRVRALQVDDGGRLGGRWRCGTLPSATGSFCWRRGRSNYWVAAWLTTTPTSPSR